MTPKGANSMNESLMKGENSVQKNKSTCFQKIIVLLSRGVRLQKVIYSPYLATLIKFSNSAFLVRFYKSSVFTPAAKIKYISFQKYSCI